MSSTTVTKHQIDLMKFLKGYRVRDDMNILRWGDFRASWLSDSGIELINHHTKALKRSLNCVSIMYSGHDAYDMKFWNSDPFMVTKNKAAMPQNFTSVRLIKIPKIICDTMGLNY